VATYTHDEAMGHPSGSGQPTSPNRLTTPKLRTRFRQGKAHDGPPRGMDCPVYSEK
jgi:hypothetical protein